MRINLQRLLVILLIFAFGFWDMHLVSQWTELQAQKKRFANLGKELSDLELKLRRIGENDPPEKILEDLSMIKEKLYAVSRVRFSNAEFLSFISKAAAALSLTDIRPEITEKKPKKKTALKTLSVKLRLRARYHEAARFMNMMERSPYMIRIRGFSISRGEKDPTGPVYVTILMNVYRFA